MAKRQAISKKLRFEIFKRDSFACQYCGKSAPEVILEIDHIQPVTKQGKNDILNLITACYDCNRGKSNNQLTENSVLSKQIGQLKALNEKREQLKLLTKWKDELLNIDNEQITIVENFWSKLTNSCFTESGKRIVLNLIKKFGFSETMDALKLAQEKYVKYKDNIPTRESLEIAFKKASGILYLNTQPEKKRKISYIKGICRNRFNFFNERKAAILLNDYFKIFDDYDNCIEFAKECKNWSQWYDGMLNYIEKHGKEIF
mgnify:CR=1 FL=1